MGTSTRAELWVGVPVRDLDLKDSYILDYVDNPDEIEDIVEFSEDYLGDVISLAYDGEDTGDRIFGIQIKGYEIGFSLEVSHLEDLIQEALVELETMLVDMGDVEVHVLATRL